MNFRTRQRAFALVIVLALLSLAVLVTLALAALSRIGSEAARANEYRVQARQNALLALHTALGQLQLRAGPDSVLSGMAGISGVQSGAQSRARHWCGIWNSDRGFVTWLSTGASGPGIPDLAEGVTMVATASLGADLTDREHVRALRLPLFIRSAHGEITEGGGFAYWIGDEGVKLSISIPEAESPITSANHAINQHFTAITPASPSLLTLVSYEQVNFVGATTIQRQGGFHSYGRTHYGVTNTSLVAGMLNVNSTSVRYWTGIGATLIRNNPAVAGSMTAAQFGSDAAGVGGRPFRTVDDFLTALATRLAARNVSPAAFASAMRPWFAVRSDTFRIRAYGDSGNTETATSRAAVAYCEAIVQRTPEMMPDGSGRRFVITYFRWLSSDDI